MEYVGIFLILVAAGLRLAGQHYAGPSTEAVSQSDTIGPIATVRCW